MNRLVSRLSLLIAASAIAATTTGALATTAGAATTSAPLAHVHRLTGARHGASAGTQTSENWSGYIKSGTSGAFTSSSASWTVPTLATTYSGYSSTWVGVDGATSGDQYLIQTGTEADVVRGRASYDAWYEVITPSDEAPETLFTGLTIHAGDKITATVAKTSSTKWSMTLTDTTSGVTKSKSASFKGPGESAEWVQEDTDVNGYISTAPNWHSVTFSKITVNGVKPALNYADSVDIYDTHGTQEDSTGQPNGTGDGFTVTWLATGTKTYVG